MPQTRTFSVPLSYLENPSDPASERYALVDLEGAPDASTPDGGLLNLNGITGGKWDEKDNDAPLTSADVDALNGHMRSDKKLYQSLEDAWTEKYWAQDPADYAPDPMDEYHRRTESSTDLLRAVGGVQLEEATPVEIVSGPDAGKSGTIVQFVPSSPDGGQEHYVVDVGEDQPVNVPELYLRKEENTMEDPIKSQVVPAPVAVPGQPPALAGLTAGLGDTGLHTKEILYGMGQEEGTQVSSARFLSIVKDRYATQSMLKEVYQDVMSNVDEALALFNRGASQFLKDQRTGGYMDPKKQVKVALDGLTVVGHLTAVDGFLVPTELLKGADLGSDESKMLFDLPEEAIPDVSEAKDAAKPADADIRNTI